MDKYQHPMTSSWMMDLPIQIEQAKKLLLRTSFIKSLQKRFKKYRNDSALKVATTLSITKQGETVSLK